MHGGLNPTATHPSLSIVRSRLPGSLELMESCQAALTPPASFSMPSTMLTTTNATEKLQGGHALTEDADGESVIQEIRSAYLGIIAL